MSFVPPKTDSLENTAWNSEAVQEDLRNHILKASALDASHIVTNRSGDILVLITISMGKEKSQFFKILIESIHRWNRSQISIRAVYLTMSGTVARAAQTVTESSRLGDYYPV